MHHYRKTKQTYTAHNNADKNLKSACPFPLCSEGNTQTILHANDTMYIIANRVSYDVFEGRHVEDHLMVIPKRHIETFADFTDQEKLDLMSIVGEYEPKGYNAYARGVGSITRSVKHQHTHLIKLDNTTPTKLLFFVHKPYFLIKL